MPTWLVTGGAGFIDGNFVLEAVARGIKVVNLDALTYAGNLRTLASLEGNPGHVFVQGDIGDRALVERLLAEGDAALAELLDEYPGADRQQLRTLVRNALAEKAKNKPPRAFREIYQVLRELVIPAQSAAAGDPDEEAAGLPDGIDDANEDDGRD